MTTTPDQERAAIVAWLRGQADEFEQESRSGDFTLGYRAEAETQYSIIRKLALAIERGDHKGE